MSATKARRAYTAAVGAQRCTAHAKTAVNGEGARCMLPAIHGKKLCKTHAYFGLVESVKDLLKTGINHEDISPIENAANRLKARNTARALLRDLGEA